MKIPTILKIYLLGFCLVLAVQTYQASMLYQSITEVGGVAPYLFVIVIDIGILILAIKEKKSASATFSAITFLIDMCFFSTEIEALSLTRESIQQIVPAILFSSTFAFLIYFFSQQIGESYNKWTGGKMKGFEEKAKEIEEAVKSFEERVKKFEEGSRTREEALNIREAAVKGREESLLGIEEELKRENEALKRELYEAKNFEEIHRYGQFNILVKGEDGEKSLSKAK